METWKTRRPQTAGIRCRFLSTSRALRPLMDTMMLVCSGIELNSSHQKGKKSLDYPAKHDQLQLARPLR